MPQLVHILFLLFLLSRSTTLSEPSAEDFLSLGDKSLSQDHSNEAIQFYEQGIKAVDEDNVSLITFLSLYTNCATAYSSLGQNEKAVDYYQRALLKYATDMDKTMAESIREDATAITAQASFFLGMVFQDLEQYQDAVDAYSQAHVLDPHHWAAVANLAAVYHDSLSDHRKALQAYNQAYKILTRTDSEVEPTDPPAEPRFILSQLQYRIGLCISHNLDAKCALVDDPDTPVSCKELATHAFAQAVDYDPDNEPAKHMLATITADATMKRASNTYIKSLFDDYAGNFEHSLVKELRYTGYERLRRAFDRAFDQKPPTFAKVVDAGCGTGLVGEQFRNISKYLIGVDLSEAIILEAQKARPNLYDEVKVGDVTEVFMAEKPISMIVAADSFIYFGDLDPLFQSMEESLEEGGYVALTLENVSEDSEASLLESKPDWRWQLTASGRFAHRKEYVHRVAEDHNLRLFHYEPLDGFRYERGLAVRGHVFIVQKKSKKDEL